MAWDVCVEQRWRFVFMLGCALLLAAAFLASSAEAEDNSPELIQPPVCSRATVSDPALKGICEVTLLAGGHNEVKINLTAEATPIEVAGYTVVTENYNGNYLTPVVEAMPGDTVAAHLVNLLPPLPPSQCHAEMAQGDTCENPTNLHYFHGGIVSPQNDRAVDLDAGKGHGDNIYVYLKNGLKEPGKPHSFDFSVPIPTELNGDVLEAKKKSPQDLATIPYPLGLNWYHSHLHGISSDQVMGGMSGLLSVGDPRANVRACRPDPNDKTKCTNDVDTGTADLRNRTEVRYVLLRDIPLRLIEDADGQEFMPTDANEQRALWAPEARDFVPDAGDECGVWIQGQPNWDDASLRKGFCQRSKDTAWLFTLNGQRFPTITVEGGHNLLLRLANVSANVAYWLELYKATIHPSGTIVPVLDGNGKSVSVPLTILTLDGVVPAKPVDPHDATVPIAAFDVPDLLLMPASRAEIYVRNDTEQHDKPQVFILRTKGPNMDSDHWPEIQLAKIVLKPNVEQSPTLLALNTPAAQISTPLPSPLAALAKAELPSGCVEDLDPAKKEHRRVTFFDERRKKFSIGTEIVHPPGKISKDKCTTSEGLSEDKCEDESQFKPDPDKTVGILNQDGITLKAGIPFENYEQPDGGIDWLGEKSKKHVCIEFRPGGGSHKQLWVLLNKTSAVHNFHIHQMKFRLANKEDLDISHVSPPPLSHACGNPTTTDPCNSIPADRCGRPDFRYYEDGCNKDPETKPEWHDTIPVPIGTPVFLIMSFDDEQQIGRFVFHCHILKHEDRGLMAPIEVWNPKSTPVAR